MMNVTSRVTSDYPSIVLPSKSLVDASLAVTVVFTIITPVLNGILILVIAFSKQLRSQSHQWLVANYLMSYVALMFGFGIYRILQIQNYRHDGFTKSSKETNCGVAKFLEFPIMTSNFCLLFLGCERYILAKYDKKVSWIVLFLFLILPWTLSIYRYSFELTSSKTRYLNIPYAGLCIDITGEKEKRRNVYVVFNIAIPLVLALTTIILAYYKTFHAYKNDSTYLRRRSFSDLNEEAFLLHRKKFFKKVIFRSTNLVAILLSLHVVITTITSILFSQFSRDDLSQDYKDIVGILGNIILLLETSIVPIICLALNHKLQEALIKFLFKMFL